MPWPKGRPHPCPPGCACGKHRDHPGRHRFLEDRLGWNQRGYPRWRYWTPERVVAAIKRWADRAGHAPRQIDGSRGSRDGVFQGTYRPGTLPSPTTARAFFGSWTAAVQAAGLEPRAHTWHRRDDDHEPEYRLDTYGRHVCVLCQRANRAAYKQRRRRR